MKILLLGGGIFKGSELESFQIPGAWRKATRNMIMATASIERALNEVPDWLDRAKDETALVLGSNSGELDTSSDFLMTLAKTKMARPLLFQNSLHNATTGFASIHFKLTGPTFSISSGVRMPGEGLDLARTLIQDGACGACLVTLVEGHKMLSGFIGRRVEEGAVTVLLGREDFVREKNILGQFSEFDFTQWSKDYEQDADTAPLFSISNSAFFQNVLRGEWKSK